MNTRKKTNFPSERRIAYKIPNFLQGISTEYDSGMLPHKMAIESYNFDFSGGSLKSGMGFVDGVLDFVLEENREKAKNTLASIGSIIKIFVYRSFDKDGNVRNDKLLFLNSSLVLFIMDIVGGSGDIVRVRDIVFSSVPNAISYRLDGKDVLIFVSKTDNMIVYDGESMPFEVLDAPKISSADIHFERLFVTTTNERSMLLFSDDLDPTNWSIDLSEAGYIEMLDERGALNKVISFGDYLYVFRDYGISRVTAFGDQENFSVSHLFVSVSKIYPETVVVCGDRILFLASDGLYAFDGFNTVRILSEFENVFDSLNSCAHGAFFAGKYYLSFKAKFDERSEFQEGDFVNNCLLEYDIKTKKYRIARGVDVVHIQPVCVGGHEKLLIACKGQQQQNYVVATIDDGGSFFGEPLFKVWKTDFFAFSSGGSRKCLRAFSVDVLGTDKVVIWSDSGQKEILNLQSGARTYHTFVFGGKFAFEFLFESSDAKILSPELTILIGGDD